MHHFVPKHSPNLLNGNLETTSLCYSNRKLLEKRILCNNLEMRVLEERDSLMAVYVIPFLHFSASDVPLRTKTFAKLVKWKLGNHFAPLFKPKIPGNMDFVQRLGDARVVGRERFTNGWREFMW
ncbi:hypothetical protein CEXT_11641 [Caerostris extrusa]|uniref:Uncharacterized protein n=1 Tax=Caerostris extrusa TaxID=172846 RepID=A0AAV4XEL0_CAEEX|nr:hypothetical protein CEXT_11641 [Caerostris extrusa]